jgi:ABC-type glycerol-3-phosphate transport system substrate-binding protein
VKALEATIASFESEHPNTKINLVNIPWGEIFTKWQTGIQSGDVPDVSIASATFSGSFQTQNALEPLDDVISELGGDSAFAPSARTLLSLCKHSPPGASGYDRPQAQAAMTTGRIAMFVYGSWLGGPLYSLRLSIWIRIYASRISRRSLGGMMWTPSISSPQFLNTPKWS